MTDPDAPLRRFILMSFAIFVLALLAIVLAVGAWREMTAP